jgi:CheY-like chemotaxis protein
MLLQGKRVFIVEDDAGNLAVASVYLRQQGATISYDRWGRETPQTILAHLPIDVILMDLMFPNNVSGFDVFEQIRQVEALAAIPVVAVSAADPDSAMPKALALGFSGFISKPVSPRIAKHIARVIEGKKVWAAEDTLGF